MKEEEKKKEKTINEYNIFEKMDAITNEIGVVGKNLKVQVNKTSSYSAVSEKDIIDAVKPIEHKYRVYSYPFDRKIIDKDVLVKETEYQDTKTGNLTTTKTNSLYMRLETIYRFVNLDNIQEYIDIKAYGDGIDTGDKAPGKAETYADKYALMKAYKISTGDDPDKEASPEKGYKKATKKEKVQEEKTNYRELIYKYCEENNIDINEIAKTYKLNSRTPSDEFEKVYFDLMLSKDNTQKVDEFEDGDGWKKEQE